MLATLLGLAASTPSNADEELLPFTPGNIMVASFLTHEVFEFDTGRDVGDLVEVRSIPVTGPGGMTFGGPHGHLFVASIATGKITEIDRSGTVLRSVPVVDQSIASPAVFGLRGLTRGPNGNLFVSVCGAEFGGDAVFELDSTTLKLVREIRQRRPVTIVCPGGIGFGPGGILYVTGINSGNVIGLDLSDILDLPPQAAAHGARSGDAPVFAAPVVREVSIVEPGESPVDSLRALAFDSAGNLYVSGFGLGRVAVIAPGATAVTHTIAVGIPTGMRIGRSTVRDQGLVDAVDAENLFVGDLSVAGVLEIDLETAAVVRVFENDDMDLDARFVVFVPNPFQ